MFHSPEVTAFQQTVYKVFQDFCKMLYEIKDIIILKP